MPDRIARGLWPHAPLSFTVVAKYLATALEKNEGCFPSPWELHRGGQIVREGGTIERQADGRFIYRSYAAAPSSPTTVNRSVETIFRSAREAAEHYLKWDLQLPGDLDGWEVRGE